MAPRRVRYVADGWGVGEIWVDGERVVWHELPRPGRELDARGDDLPVVEALRAYFAGENVDLHGVALELDAPTRFRRAAAQALRGVRRGETVTYGELAALAGHPGAHRAAGTFCARNALPLFVPCHRVVAAGGLGSYGSLGLEYKRRLLALEGVDDAR